MTAWGRFGGWVILLGVLAVCSSSPSDARAQARGDDTDGGWRARSADSAQAGMFLPLTMAPRTDSQNAFASVHGGYDGAREGELFEGTAEVTLIGPLAARVGVLHVGNPSSLRPTGGLRVQALDQESHGIDLSIGAFYKPEGFTEAEGELEGVVALGGRLGAFGLFGNVVYGQDPEAAERDGELRLAALYELDARAQTGFDARVRLDLGSEEGKRRAEGGAEYDLLAGPLFTYAFDAVAVTAQAGLAGIDRNGMQLGFALLGGLAGSL